MGKKRRVVAGGGARLSLTLSFFLSFYSLSQFLSLLLLF